MTPRAGRAVARFVGAMLAALAPATLAITTLVALPTSAAAAQYGLALEVRITAVDPTVLQPGQDLRVRAEIRNTGDAPVARPHILVHLDPTAFISRYSLDRWRTAGPGMPLGPTVLENDLPGPLAPGQTATVDLIVPAGSVGLPSRSTSWGARGLAVEVVNSADPARTQLGLARTFALWFPTQELAATQVSIVAPVTGVAVDPRGQAWSLDLERLTQSGGRLADLLAATGNHPEVTWAVDPWLTDPTSSAGSSATAWAAALRSGMGGREVILLPYLDPDIAALAHADTGQLLTAATDRARAAAGTAGFPEDADVTLAWPADSLPDLATAALAGSEGFDAILVGPGDLPPPEVLTYTPTGVTTITAGGEDVTVLVPDERLSTAVTTGAVGPLATEAELGTITPATAAQDLLAELAVITRERPADPRHVLITVPRTWNPDVAVVTAQLDALAAAPWVNTMPISSLIDADDPQIDRGTLPNRTVIPTEVDPGSLESVRAAVEQRGQLASILTDPTKLIGDLEAEQLAITSVAWRADPAGRSRSVTASALATQTLAEAVTVQASQVNLISASGGLPVEVANSLNQDVTVAIALAPDDDRLVAEKVVQVTVPADSQVTVQVPVHAVQSGDVVVTVVLQSVNGVVLDANTHFTVLVRAEWETIGTAVVGALLALGLIVGVIRTIRRGRTARRTAPQTASDPDTLSPEGTDLDEETTAGGWGVENPRTTQT